MESAKFDHTKTNLAIKSSKTISRKRILRDDGDQVRSSDSNYMMESGKRERRKSWMSSSIFSQKDTTVKKDAITGDT